MMARRLALAAELAALGGAIAAAWWLADAATAAWLARVAELGVPGPSAGEVHGLARRAALWFTLGVAALAAARALGPGARALRGRRGGGGAGAVAAAGGGWGSGGGGGGAGGWRTVAAGEPLLVPWLLPAAVTAALFGLAIHLATVEVSRGAALAPTGAAFAQGVLAGCAAAAALLLAPVDLAAAIARGRLPLALAIGAIFAALALAGSGPPGSGTRINLGPLQPIELVKPLAVAFLAAYLGARAPKLRWHRRRLLGLRWPRLELLVPALGVLVAIVAGLYVIGDLGPVLLLALVFLGMFFVVSRATGWVVVALALLALVLLVLGQWPALAGGGTVQTRLVMWQDPWTNGLSNGYQLGEGLWALNAGGWTGQGLARAATPLVPAGKTDLVLATLTEQLGARGLAAYQLALGALVLGALHVAARSRTAERVLLASGIAILLLAQWLVILGGTLGHLPLTGIVVPFVSAGRSSMIVFLAAVGLVARLAIDGRARAASAELDELHAAARGVRAAAALAIALAVLAGTAAALGDRAETAARGIVARLADGTVVHRQNPRLVAIAARLRRGAILDRRGAPLAESAAAGARAYPLGAALGTLLGTWPSRVLLPSWALERRLDERLRGYPERTGGPREPGREPGRDRALPWPDLRAFVPLLDLGPRERAAAIAALDADVAARSVRVTLDAALQAQVAALLRDAVARGRRLAAAAVVLDVDTGEVLARAQVPDYDPGQAAWQERVLAGDAAYLARFRGAYGEWPDKTGVQGMFQSGSIGKVATAIAAARAGVAGARFECRESDAQGPLFTVRGWPRPIHDHTGDRPHGAPDLVQALAVSCNVYFGQLGLALGPEPFAALVRDGLDLGYGAALDAGAPGTRQLASTAFGQGAMVMSPMQAARLTAAAAGGGRYVRCPPTMELGAACAERALVADPEAMRPVVAGMRRVMTAGTGARLAAPAGVRVYGKTGTADVRGFAGEEPFGIARAAEARPHSWFVAFAEPAAAPEGAPVARGRLAVAVVVPRGGTGASAAGPIAMQIVAAAHGAGYLR